MKSILLRMLLISTTLTSTISIAEVRMNGKKEFGIKGKLVSAYYNNQFLGNTDLALIFVIERPGSQNEFVGFTGNDIPIAASMIPALGKTIKIVQSNSNGTLGYNLQAIAE